jgi:hypothetical protein
VNVEMNEAVETVVKSVGHLQKPEHVLLVIDLHKDPKSLRQWFFLHENDTLKAGSKGNYNIKSEKFETVICPKCDSRNCEDLYNDSHKAETLYLCRNCWYDFIVPNDLICTHCKQLGTVISGGRDYLTGLPTLLTCDECDRMFQMKDSPNYPKV